MTGFSNLLWLFPEMARFLDLIQASRVHSWMRCFGHPLPKPSVFMSNIKDEIVGPLLRRQWSAKMEALWQKKIGCKIDVCYGHTKSMDQQVQEVQDSMEISLESRSQAEQVRKEFLQNPPIQEQQKIRFRREAFERFWDLHSRFLPGCFRCLADSLPFTFQRIYFCRFISG